MDPGFGAFGLGVRVTRVFSSSRDAFCTLVSHSEPGKPTVGSADLSSAPQHRSGLLGSLVASPVDVIAPFV